MNEQPVKRGRGRPKGSKNKKPTSKAVKELRKYDQYEVDPQTGYAVAISGGRKQMIGRIGDEKVTAFVAYHMEMLKMREGVNKKDVSDLYQRFYRYLAYCAEKGIIPNNMNAYFAMGVTKQDISYWKAGTYGTPEHKKFAEDVTQFFASVHEQAPTEGLMNPISAMFWQKAHDGMVEASKLEVVQNNPLGEKKSAEEIAKAYDEINLPD